jgi:hypothetical protein
MLLLDIEQRVTIRTAMPPNHLEGWEVRDKGIGLRRQRTAASAIVQAVEAVVAAAHTCCMLLEYTCVRWGWEHQCLQQDSRGG